MEQLTKSEEKIMHIIWKLKKCFVNDIIAEIPKPSPPYNTISSIVRILEKKGFVAYKAYGRTYEYFPAIKKSAYKKMEFKNFIKNYFDGSYENVVSYMVSEDEISEKELQDIKKIIEKNKKTTAD